MHRHVGGFGPHHRRRTAVLVLFGALWTALHFGVGRDDDD
jgi:hypothetical protein